MPTDPKQLFDSNYLNEVLSFDSMSDGEKKELVQSLIDDVTEKITKIGEQLESGQLSEELYSHSHSIKGNARSFGSYALGDSAEQMEHALKTGDIGQANAQFEKLKGMYLETKAYLHQLYFS